MRMCVYVCVCACVHVLIGLVLASLTKCLCVCVCLCLCAGRTILKREARMGPGPPAVTLGASLKKTKATALTGCGAASSACSGRGRGPHLSQNLWGVGVMSPRSLLSRAWQRPAAYSASSWQGGGGSHPPFLACVPAPGPVPRPGPAVVCVSSPTVCPPPQGGGPPLFVSPAVGPA